MCCDPGDILRAFAGGPPQHQMIVCYDRYDWFQQIPFGAGVEHSFYLVYARVTFVVFLRCSDHALGLCALGSHHGLLAVIFIVVTQR